MCLVTATIRDPNGILYVNAIVIANFVGQSVVPGAGPYVAGGVPQGQFETVIPLQTDSFGFYAVNLPGNDIISPSPSQWRFTVVSNTTPPLAFALQITISGASQDISAAMQAAAANIISPIVAFNTITVSGLSTLTGGIAAPVRTGDGTAAAPAYAFISEIGTGYARLSAGQLGLSILGASKVLWDVTQRMGSTFPLTWSSAVSPFGTPPDTGASRLSPGIIAIGNGSQGDVSGALTTTNHTAVSLGTATSGGNFGSGNVALNGSWWNGSAAVAESWTLNASPASTVPNPQTSFFNIIHSAGIPSSRVQFVDNNPATSGANFRSPDLDFIGHYWNGTASAVDEVVIRPVYGTGTNPTITLTLTHAGSSGVFSADFSAAASFKASTIFANGTVGVALTGDIATCRTTSTGMLWLGSDGAIGLFRSGASTLSIHNASGELGIPLVNDTLVGWATAATLTNKTIPQAGLSFTGSVSGTTSLQPSPTAGGIAQLPAISGTDTLAAIATTQTLTNKRVTPRSVAVADATSITPNSDTSDIVTQVNTQVGGTLTINAPTGTPTDGQKLQIRIKATNSQTYSFNGAYHFGSTITAPTTLAAGKTDYIGCEWNATNTAWDVVAVAQGY